MRHVLHLVKDPASQTALDVIARQSADPDLRVSVVLLHAARDLTVPLPREVFRLDETGSVGSAAASYPAIDHDRLLELIFAADTVVSW